MEPRLGAAIPHSSISLHECLLMIIGVIPEDGCVQSAPLENYR